MKSPPQDRGSEPDRPAERPSRPGADRGPQAPGEEAPEPHAEDRKSGWKPPPPRAWRTITDPPRA